MCAEYLLKISHKKRRFLLLLGVATMLVLPCTTMASEKDTSTETEQSVSAEDQNDLDTFEYLLEGRPDPFLPFIQPKVATTLDPNEIITDDVELTGMQLFEPGQLTLVAVMLAGDKKIAMVEDVTGKGYVINEGMLIGRNGMVSDITEDNDIIITETARTRSGKELITTIVMRLNKEGDL